jgi:hypothetical protein
MKFDCHGVLMADVPNAGVSRQDTNARSGNPRHDVNSGKFGDGGGRARRNTTPANVNAKDFARMRDAVREAARQFKGALTIENIQSFINKRASNPNAVNVQQFAQLVQQQQMDDLVDAITGKAHGGVKLNVPRDYIKKVLAGLSDDDVAEIVARVQARGIKDPHLNIGKALDKTRRDSVKEKHAALQASDAVEMFVAAEEQGLDVEEELSRIFDPVELAEVFAKAIPAPVINIEPPQVIVQSPPPQRMRNTPVRDSNGLISYTIQEPMNEDPNDVPVS